MIIILAYDRIFRSTNFSRSFYIIVLSFVHSGVFFPLLSVFVQNHNYTQCIRTIYIYCTMLLVRVFIDLVVQRVSQP